MKKYYSLFLAAVFVIGGGLFIKDYFKGSDKEKVATLSKLISEGKVAVAVLDSEYTEKTVKIAKVPVKTYEIGYTFEADGQAVHGQATLYEAPTEAEVEVKYLPSDPNINSLDPEKELQKEQEKETSNSALYVGLGFFAVAGFYGFRFNKQRQAGA